MRSSQPISDFSEFFFNLVRTSGKILSPHSRLDAAVVVADADALTHASPVQHVGVVHGAQRVPIPSLHTARYLLVVC